MPKNMIPTESLTIDLIPSEDDNIDIIFDFALTFDTNEIDYKFNVEPRPNLSEDRYTLKELRAHLYTKQRAWNHMMRKPDKQSEQIIRMLVRLIRDKVQQNS